LVIDISGIDQKNLFDVCARSASDFIQQSLEKKALYSKKCKFNLAPKAQWSRKLNISDNNSNGV